MSQLKTILSIITICSFITALSQDHTLLPEKQTNKKQRRFVVHATGLYNINRNSGRELTVYTAPSHPPIRALHVNNTFGYQAGVTYEYRNKKMVTFSPGILYGVQHLSYDNAYTLDHVEPQYEFPRHTVVYNIRMASKYLAPSFALGYDYELPKNRNWVFQAKLGLSFLLPLNNLDRDTRLFVNYKKGTDTFGAVQFAYTGITRNNSPIGYPYYNTYIGAVYKTPGLWIKDIRAGISFTHAFGFFTGEGDDFIGTFSNQYATPTQGIVGTENYYDRFRNVGLSLSIGF